MRSATEIIEGNIGDLDWRIEQGREQISRHAASRDQAETQLNEDLALQAELQEIVDTRKAAGK